MYVLLVIFALIGFICVTFITLCLITMHAQHRRIAQDARAHRPAVPVADWPMDSEW